MKKIFQYATLAASVATALGASAPASAVNLSSNGLGEVVIVPYYTVRNSLDTYLSIVNTSPKYVVAVKLRFREADNSRDARDFNVFLSPNDVWTAAVTMAADGETPVIQTTDISCTAPALIETQATMPGMRGVEMTSAAYDGTSADYPAPDTGSTSIERTQEGYVEIIAMGVADPATSQIADWAMHPDPECGRITNQYSTNPVAFKDQFSEPLNVIKATGAIVAVGAGASTGLPVTTLANFFNPNVVEDPNNPHPSDIMFRPDSPFPNMNNAVPPTSAQITEAGPIVDNFARGVDAVSSLMMARSVLNEYALGGDAEAATQWVVTFPTKNFYVDRAENLPVNAPAPFQFFFQGDSDGDGLSCVNVDYGYYDREEDYISPESNLDFSPRPPGVPGTSICQESQTLSFGGAFLGSGNNYGVPLAAGFENGWMRLTFTAATGIAGASYNYGGLPVIGFGVKLLENSVEQAGVLRNYAIVQDHAYQRQISRTTP